MALNIKNAEVEQLAEELARLGGTSKTELSGRHCWSAKNALRHCPLVGIAKPA